MAKPLAGKVAVVAGATRGARPHFVRWLRDHVPEVAAAWRKADDGFYA